jgi:pilus assembly protein Flp/PilA
MVQYDFIKAWMQAQCKTERGASLVEYALLVALIAVVCIAAVTFIGKSADTKFSTVGSSINKQRPATRVSRRGRVHRTRPRLLDEEASAGIRPGRHRREATMRNALAMVHIRWMRQAERAASLVEYALLIALIALAMVAAVTFLGDSTRTSLDGAGSSIYQS